MHELQIACIPLAIYLALVIGAYIHARYTRINEIKKKRAINKVNNWIRRVCK
jgi:uncharacterized protein YneF (UPF0154 family)